MNSQLDQKLKEEAKSRIREEEACKEANKKVRTLDGRIAFLLSKLQSDEEARSTQQEEMKNMESQVQRITQQCNVLQTKLTQAEDSAKNVINKLQQSNKLLKEAQIKQQSAEQHLQEEHALIGFREEMKATQAKGKPENSLAAGSCDFSWTLGPL